MGQTDRQTDKRTGGCIAALLNAPIGGDIVIIAIATTAIFV